LISITFRRISSLELANSPKLAIPAQFTVSRSWPWAARAFSKAAATLASSVTSTAQKTPPISAAIESLNVSNAAAIALYAVATRS